MATSDAVAVQHISAAGTKTHLSITRILILMSYSQQLCSNRRNTSASRSYYCFMYRFSHCKPAAPPARFGNIFCQHDMALPALKYSSSTSLPESMRSRVLLHKPRRVTCQPVSAAPRGKRHHMPVQRCPCYDARRSAYRCRNCCDPSGRTITRMIRRPLIVHLPLAQRIAQKRIICWKQHQNLFRSGTTLN